MKISFIGSGGVACSTAFATGLKINDINEIVMLDIFEDWAKGKAIDLHQGFLLVNKDIKTIGTTDYSNVKGSDVVVITAGFADKGGKSDREALLAKNKEIITEVGNRLKEVIPTDDKQPLIIVVTNPLDLILNCLIKVGGFNKKKTIGSGNWLDSGRLRDFISRETGISCINIKSYAIAQHGAKIVYLLSKTTVNGKSFRDFAKENNISKEKIKKICDSATDGSQEIIGLLQRESTIFGPAVSIFNLIDSYINDKKDLLVASVYCEGEYGIKNFALGCPVVIGKNGVEKIEIFELDDGEKRRVAESFEFTKGLDF
jgi:malate dehydrogenase